MPSRSLSTAELTHARRAYEAGASFREIAAEHSVSHSTMRLLLRSVGVASRPQGWPHRQNAQLAPPPQPRPAVEIAPDAGGRLRIPWRTREERRNRFWTPSELQAIAVERAAGRYQVIPRGRSGLPERPSIAERTAAGIAFWIALQKVKAAA